MPQLIHATLAFAATFIGVAAFYFLLGAEFVGLVQVFVYVGAVAVLIVFTILLTRRDPEKDARVQLERRYHCDSRLRRPGLVDSENTGGRDCAPQIEALTVKRIGETLMTDYVWPLQCVGVLLTAALIGALILVMEEKR